MGEVPDSFFEETKEKLLKASNHLFEIFDKIDGLHPIRAKGAMYMMIKIVIDQFKDIKDDVDFCKKMLIEERVFLMPSECFFEKNMFRVVLCNKHEKFDAMGARIEKFCQSHIK